MMMIKRLFCCVALLAFGCNQATSSGEINTKKAVKPAVPLENAPLLIDSTRLSQYQYPWQKEASTWSNCLAGRIAPPSGYERISLPTNSFGDWLRHLPLAPINSPVKYHDGQLKNQQHLHQAVISIDVGKRDLQQCADAVMRMRAEYLYSQTNYDAIGFKFTNGDPAPFQQWKSGKRISIQNNRLVWVTDGSCNSSHASFRKYMDQIFTYAGTASLSKELTAVKLPDMQVGDVFIKGGFPGHAVLVVDMAVHPETGKKLFMVAQSYMPAQSIHVLKNFNQPELGSWYSIEDCLSNGEVSTPQWLFELDQLKRF